MLLLRWWVVERHGRRQAEAHPPSPAGPEAGLARRPARSDARRAPDRPHHLRQHPHARSVRSPPAAALAAPRRPAPALAELARRTGGSSAAEGRRLGPWRNASDTRTRRSPAAAALPSVRPPGPVQGGDRENPHERRRQTLGGRRRRHVAGAARGPDRLPAAGRRPLARVRMRPTAAGGWPGSHSQPPRLACTGGASRGGGGWPGSETLTDADRRPGRSLSDCRPAWAG